MKDEKNIKMIFEEHIGRIGAWPPSWADVEDVIREAYWKGVESGSMSKEYPRENTYEDWNIS